MTEHIITTYVDEKPVEWQLTGDLQSSAPVPISTAQHTVFHWVGKDGYKIVNIPPSIQDVLSDYILKKCSK